jgi:phosphoglycerate dehydrogenase-like enzyme
VQRAGADELPFPAAAERGLGVSLVPQQEIEMVAESMEAEWARLMPLTHAAFERNGRVCP